VEALAQRLAACRLNGRDRVLASYVASADGLLREAARALPAIAGIASTVFGRWADRLER